MLVIKGGTYPVEGLARRDKKRHKTRGKKANTHTEKDGIRQSRYMKDKTEQHGGKSA